MTMILRNRLIRLPGGERLSMIPDDTRMRCLLGGGKGGALHSTYRLGRVTLITPACSSSLNRAE